MIHDGELAPDEKMRQDEALRAVVRYCSNTTDCRRVQVLSHFSEAFKAADCKKGCDVCKESPKVIEEDMTQHGVQVLRLVQSVNRNGSAISKTQHLNVYKGSKCKEVYEKGHDKLPLFGAGEQMSRDRIERLYDHLLVLGALQEKGHKNHAGWSNMCLHVSAYLN